MRSAFLRVAPTLIAASLAASLSTPASAEPSIAATAAPSATATGAGASNTDASTRSGREIYESFRAGLAEPDCPSQPGAWSKHFASAPQRLSNRSDNTLALFGHVVDSVRAAHLPTEYALIPFVESGYKPNARSGSGPVGMWQMIGSTARNHHVPMRPGYDGRLSPVDSTRAAVRYLKTLHGMFGGNWRLAVMAYNVGEYRVFGALKRSGQRARTARPESLAGLPDITRVYDDKLHAISCVMTRADAQPRWLATLDRPVARLAPVSSSDQMVTPPPRGHRELTDTLVAIAAAPAIVFGTAAVAPGSAAAALGTRPVTQAPVANLATTPETARAVALQATSTHPVVVAGLDPASIAATPAPILSVTAISNAPRRHTVAAGESLWRIARRYGVSVSDLVGINARLGITDRLLSPGMVLAIDSLGIASK